MIYWKHSFNFTIFALLSVWLFLLAQYLKNTQKYLKTDKDKQDQKILYIITWILFSFGCIGALGALLEMVGVLRGKIYLI